MSTRKAGPKPDINPKPKTGPEFPIVVKLEDPIEWGSETIAEIKIHRKPRGGDLWGMPIEGVTVGHIMEVVSKVSGTAPPCLELLSFNDTTQLVEVITPFLENGS